VHAEVRATLFACGWTAQDDGTLTKYAAAWHSDGDASVLTGPGRRPNGVPTRWAVEFPAAAPTAVVIAAAQAAAEVRL